MQPTPSELLGIAALLAFASIGTAEDAQTGGPEDVPLPTKEVGPVILIEPLPMLLPRLPHRGPVQEVKCTMSPMTAGCTLTLYKDGKKILEKEAEETKDEDLTISHPVGKPEDGRGYKCVLCCAKEIPPFTVGTTPPGKTVQPETISPSTYPTSTLQSTTVQASTRTPGTTGPLTTFLKSLTTATNPPSTAQPTTPPATTQVTTGQATGTTIRSATTTVVTLRTTSRETTTESLTTTLTSTTIPTTATPSIVIWASTTQSPTTQSPTTQSPTTQSPTTQSPTTRLPTSQSPTTQSPTTKSPTTPSTATDSTTILSTTSATTAIPTTTDPCTNSPANANARPKFDTLQKAYPTYKDYPKDALKLKEEMGLPDELFKNGTPNTCAIRMSKAFHDAGLGIDRSRVDKSKCDNKSANVNGKGKEYIIRVLFFRCYLRAIWGKPDICDVKGKDDIKGKKGILIFTGCKGFGQHIDLWDGERCLMACDGYFDRCSSVEFYELP